MEGSANRHLRKGVVTHVTASQASQATAARKVRFPGSFVPFRDQDVLLFSPIILLCRRRCSRHVYSGLKWQTKTKKESWLFTERGLGFQKARSHLPSSVLSSIWDRNWDRTEFASARVHTWVNCRTKNLPTGKEQGVLSSGAHLRVCSGSGDMADECINTLQHLWELWSRFKRLKKTQKYRQSGGGNGKCSEPKEKDSRIVQIPALDVFFVRSTAGLLNLTAGGVNFVVCIPH